MHLFRLGLFLFLICLMSTMFVFSRVTNENIWSSNQVCFLSFRFGVKWISVCLTMKTESPCPSWPSSSSYCFGFKMNLIKRKSSIPRWQTSARELLKSQNKDPEWKYTTALQNGHISFIYLYPRPHSEWTRRVHFLFVKVGFWYFNNLERVNLLDDVKKKISSHNRYT